MREREKYQEVSKSENKKADNVQQLIRLLRISNTHLRSKVERFGNEVRERKRLLQKY